ncbi:winged helix-turn-helix domain-containing protein [Sphingomicrobium arenosum]|uniref:winged helix-turn-helix domain-containing protein n=1 Tax=Sphingomicrobium arenosum TaxID=2233861 RepID=UPI002240B3C2|nr:winged helix-turn-helix domain-containing protein [Sphingomicrobium arenosum]
MQLERDLRARSDFRLGTLCVSPSRRLLSGPRGEGHLEPRVLSLFLCLADAAPGVVTRETLYGEVWGNAPVGEDSLNRAVAKLRRELGRAGCGEIETIPRTGYRLVVPGLAQESDGAWRVDRRRVLAGLAIGGALVAGATAVSLTGGSPNGREARRLLEAADRKLRDKFPGAGRDALAMARQAVALQPQSAHAEGIRALAHRELAETGSREEVEANLGAARLAADRALALDPDEANARTALATLRPEYGDWWRVERDLRAVLAVAPANVHALLSLTMLLQAVGRAQESRQLNDRVAALDPLTPLPQFRSGLKHWIFGEVDAAYVAIDNAWQSWPGHPAVQFARLYILTFTGRGGDAEAMLADPAVMRVVPAPVRANFAALARAERTGSRSDRETARDVMMDVSVRIFPMALTNLMGLSHLGFLDEAFALAEGAYLGRGRLRTALWRRPGDPQVADQYWRRTMNLFTPAVLPMRLDPRWARLTEAMGLERYWQASETRPDPFLMR